MSLITIREASKMFRIKPQALYTWVRQGKIPAYRLSRRVIRLDPDKIKEWLDQTETIECEAAKYEVASSGACPEKTKGGDKSDA